ncbi:MAG: response regulator [Candidatus Cloacimonetes bacterium]|nr:response regulator [Candidatus Cloacimonadota bacterium]
MQANKRTSKILVADDSATLRQRICEFMKLEGFETIEASNGEEAVELAFEHRPDLILLDVVMPKISGIDVCKQLKRSGEFQQTPILMLTVKTSAYDVSEAFKAGANDYIRKPFGAEELLLRIRVHLQTKSLVTELERLNSIKNDFIGMASHDIRTPLTNILGLTIYLKNLLKDKSEDIDFALDNIETEGDRIIQMVDTMLDLSVIQSGKFTLIKQPTLLSSFLDEAFKRSSRLGERKQIIFELKNDSKRDEIYIDPYRAHQIMDNLVSNAIKYSPENTTVKIFVKDSDENLEISVVDQGIGISQENIDKIFAPFFRDTTTETYEVKGVGLGLAIVKKIVDEYDGSVSIENLDEGGTKISFCIPV